MTAHPNNELAVNVKIDGDAFISWDMIDDAIVARIADILLSDHQLKLRERLLSIIDERIAAIIEERVVSFLAKAIPAVDRFGEPIPGGKPKSLGDMIAEAADAAMTQIVDEDGKPGRPGYYSHTTRLEWLVKKVAKEGIAAAVTGAVKEVNAQAKAEVQKQVVEAIAAQLAKGAVR